ncbi:MAG: tetratricopeptide repeat protein [Alphaproteobacteria bacterium]|jgi:tetratricopeptide (TPR) repeat protein|nr:tetratricopeptide repeat protein [Alphaproteobacteria bacterium]
MEYDGLNTRSARSLFQQAAACHKAGDLVAARRKYQQVLKREPYLVEASYHLGMALVGAGAYGKAISQLGWTLVLEPGHRDALFALARTLQITGREGQAIERFHALVSEVPDHAEAWHALGVTQKALGRLDDAEASWRRTVELAPLQGETRALLGSLLQSLGREAEGEAELDRAQALDPDNPGILCLIADGYRGAGRWPQAEALYDRALATEPGHVGASTGKALALAARGEAAAATMLLEPIIATGSTVVDLALAYAEVVPAERTRAAIGLLNRALKPGPPPGAERRALLFALGDLCDRANIAVRAFAAYQSANALAQGHFDGALFERQVSARMEAFGPDAIRPQAAKENGPAPLLLLVGLPGGGVDLVAATLTRHPGVRLLPAAPLPHHDDPRPDNPTAADLAAAAAALAPDLADGDERLAVLPLEVLDLGLATLCWPGVRVIHGNRDALDAGLHCFSHDLGPAGAFAADLDLLTMRFAAERRLLEHWQEVLDMQFLEVAYERLLRRSQETLGALFDFCRLDWHDACLEPAAAAESPGRHRRYARHLRRLRLALED